MSLPTDGLLTDEERAALTAGTYTDEDHQDLDGEVHYRIRLLAARDDSIDASRAERVAADARMLGKHGHNGLVSMVRSRLGEALPKDWEES